MEENKLEVQGDLSLDDIEENPSRISRHLETTETPSRLELLKDTQSSEMSEEFKEPYDSTSPSLRPPGLNKSVQEFFKQSNEIQEEIRQLTEMCQQISPKREFYPSSYSYPGEEQEWREQNQENVSQHSDTGGVNYLEEISWTEINGLLEKHGFNTLPLYVDGNLLIPNINEITDTLVEVLTEITNQGRALEESEGNIVRLQQEIKDLRMINDKLKEDLWKMKNMEEKRKADDNKVKELSQYNRDLQEKLAKCSEICKEKEALIMKIKGQMDLNSHSGYQASPDSRAASLFFNFMEREYNASRETDSKIMSIIMMYEDQKYRQIKELSSIKKDMDISKKYFKDLEMNYTKINQDLEDSKIENQTLKNRIKYLEQHTTSENTEKLKIINSITQALSLRSYEEILPAIFKMQQVLLALPNVDKFVTSVCAELFSGEAALSPNKLDNVVPEIQRLKNSLNEVLDYKAKLSEAYGNIDEREIIEKARGLAHFCRLFDVKRTDDIVNVVEGVFFFVHELKLFLGFARRALRLQPDSPVKQVLEEIMKIIQPEMVGFY
ncbi:unnamed protein product [Blepharisma stoltei]|uniref:Centrosomal protein of 70 kDa n=1 Tax=Blepharisma stoltei TaxID=1481888 RepID=A0AAU9K0C4_9CILI|nr:unnamed protein product [Blepharisma stoltei]